MTHPVRDAPACRNEPSARQVLAISGLILPCLPTRCALDIDRFHRIGLVGRADRSQILETLAKVFDVVTTDGREVVVEAESASLLRRPGVTTVPRKSLGDCDLVIVVGGDGSILRMARDLAHTQVPVLGINRGGLGFLADITPHQIESGVMAVLSGEFRAASHFLLELRIVREGIVMHRSPALNDVVVHSSGSSKMLELRLEVDGDFVYQQRSDGIIVSSPTGSTAYALSAGGPIMHPRLDALAIVPMFPHTLTARTLVVGANAEVAIVPQSAPSPKASCDSQVDFTMVPGDRAVISKYKHVLNLLHPNTHSFYEACRSKLDWGSRLGDR